MTPLHTCTSQRGKPLYPDAQEKKFRAYEALKLADI